MLSDPGAPETAQYYTEITHPGGEIEEKWFDGQGRLKEVYWNGYRIEKRSYFGNTTVYEDDEGYQTTEVKDEFGNVIQTVEPDGAVTKIAYDYQLQLPVVMTLPNGLVNLMQYDE